MWYDYFILVCFRKDATPFFDRKNTAFEILLKDITIRSLDLKLNLMALVMVYVEIPWKGNAPIYYKEAVIDMENLSVAENIVVHTVTVI